MTTPQDLLITILDTAATRPVPPGDLSLALAGAELIDLLQYPSIRLDGGRIVPGHLPEPADPLLTLAAASFVREEPYELVNEWLWRRGNSLTQTYIAALETQQLLVRRGRNFLRSKQADLADSPERRQAARRWASAEPVLHALAASLGISSEQTPRLPGTTDYAVDTVLAAVVTAIEELEAERHRRAIEQAAFDNLWRTLE